VRRDAVQILDFSRFPAWAANLEGRSIRQVGEIEWNRKNDWEIAPVFRAHPGRLASKGMVLEVKLSRGGGYLKRGR